MTDDPIPRARTTRRHFLKFVAVAAAAPALGACTSSTDGDSSSAAGLGDIPAGALAGLPLGSLRAIRGEPVAIGRDAGGAYAMTLRCTHAGCDISSLGTVSPSGLQCNCHGSRFDANGAVTKGPAVLPLRHFAVSIDATGNLTVHGGTEVASSTRLAV